MLKSNLKIIIVNVVDGQNVQDKVMIVVENLIIGNLDLIVIYVIGEFVLFGVIVVVENQGWQKDIKVFGWDLMVKVIFGIDGGYVIVVLQQDLEKMGVEVLNVLNSIMLGKIVLKIILVLVMVVIKVNVDLYCLLFKQVSVFCLWLIGW